MPLEASPGVVLRLTASIGVASCQCGEMTVREIQKKADLAMHRAKKEGRNRVSSFCVKNA